jgi:hypothetical protein
MAKKIIGKIKIRVVNMIKKRTKCLFQAKQGQNQESGGSYGLPPT